MLLEICVEDAAGLEAAIAGGATRIELCTALSTGGLTPPPSLMKLAGGLPIPVRVLCRPQAGGFDYNGKELALVEADIVAALEYGLEGVVIGAGNRDGLDEHGLARLVARARAEATATRRPLGLTLHRVFDVVDDMPRALETAIDLGFDTILTSGGKPRAVDGALVLADLVKQAGGRITILASSGIDASTVPALVASGIRNFHASCRQPAPEIFDSKLATLGFVTENPRRTSVQCIKRLRDALVRQSGEQLY